MTESRRNADAMIFLANGWQVEGRRRTDRFLAGGPQKLASPGLAKALNVEPAGPLQLTLDNPEGYGLTR